MEVRDRRAAGEPPTAPPAGEMREDWDRRAREDHRLHIATGHAGSEEKFLESGERDLAELVLDGIRLEREASVVEIGCGVGRLLVPLARRVARVRGVDISPVMVETSRVYLASVPNVTATVTDGTLAGVEDASCDLVFSFIVFQHIPAVEPIRTYVEEAARVLKPGGIFRFQVDGRWWWGGGSHTPGTYEGVKFTPAQAKALLVRLPFTVVDEWGAEGHYHWITARKSGSSAAVETVLRDWDLSALESVLRRLGADGPDALARGIRKGTRSLRPALVGFAERQESVDSEAFVNAAFGALLGGEGDAAGRTYHTEILTHGFEDRLALLDTLSTSREFLDVVRPFVPQTPWFAAYEILDRLGSPQRMAGFFDLVDAVAGRLPDASDEAVNAAYRWVLGLAPDEAARAHQVALLKRRADGRRLLVRTLLAGRIEPTPPPREGTRLGYPGESMPGEARTARRVLTAGAGLDDAAFLSFAYRRVLGRVPDEEGSAFYLGKLASGELSRAGFLRELLWSAERRAAPLGVFGRARVFLAGLARR